MRVHLVAVCGTGMGSLAGLLKSAGHDVSGSDVAFDPPMGPALESWGIRLLHGFSAAHLEPRPDLVVVGNVCRSDNVEARAAIDGGMNVTSMVGALDLVLAGTSPLVVAGTHGKTTTTALSAWLLDAAGLAPGFLIGGLPMNFAESFRLPARPKLPMAGRARRAPFVIEGDEYDTAFFDKTPKFWHYHPEVAIVTSIEHDHVDIYPSWQGYLDAFAGFLQRIPETGLIVAHAADPQVVALCRDHARAPVVGYGLDSDLGAEWLAAPLRDGGFDLFVGGSACGRAQLRLSGEHNVLNALAALAAVCQGFGVPLHVAMHALARFDGVARRQELIVDAGGLRVYDDFAHHPTAVRHTLAGLRRRHREGRLIAVYEARTATACRKLHQDAYLEAFDAADRVIFAPLGRDNIEHGERLDLDALVAGLHRRDIAAEAAPNIDAIVTSLLAETRAGDTIVLLSNGAFGHIQEKLRAALAS